MTTSSARISVTRDTQTRALEPPRPPHSLMRILMNPWVDKVIAIIAILPFIGPIIALFQDIGFNIPAISYIIQATILVATMVVRRTPVRITSNPLFWLLAFVASYWGFLIMAVENHGGRLAPSWLTESCGPIPWRTAATWSKDSISCPAKSGRALIAWSSR